MFSPDHDHTTVEAPEKEGLEQFKENFVMYLAGEVLSGKKIGADEIIKNKIKEQVMKALPALDQAFLDLRIPVFANEIDRYMETTGSVHYKKEDLEKMLADDIKSQLPFLLDNE